MSGDHETSGAAAKPYYSEEHIALLHETFRVLPEKSRKLAEGFLVRRYGNTQAKEYALHGFVRRLYTLGRCVENTFRILPPDLVDRPTREQLSDAAINTQLEKTRLDPPDSVGSSSDLALRWSTEHPINSIQAQLSLRCRCQAPKPRCGAAQTPGLRSAAHRGTMEPAVCGPFHLTLCGRHQRVLPLL
jgi:hypothetical protein